jgi:hypothetical protein
VAALTVRERAAFTLRSWLFSDFPGRYSDIRIGGSGGCQAKSGSGEVIAKLWFLAFFQAAIVATNALLPANW